MSTVSLGISTAQIEEWRNCIGRSRNQRECLDVNILRRFAVACGFDPDVETTQPPLAHWAYFLDVLPGSQLGTDGHPLRGEFLPAVTLPRRMFAGASIEFHGALELGRDADCTSVIVEVKHRAGQSGELVFVELERRIAQALQVKVIERRTLVFRAAGARQPPIVPASNTVPPDAWVPGPVDLFRFSAVTFNSHRIHYDVPYARDAEGYPDLVVHGPFVAVKLLGFARSHNLPEVRSIGFRMVAPLFVSQPITFAADLEEGSFAAIRCDGTPAVTAKLELA